MDISSISNNATLQSLLASSLSNSGNSSGSSSLASLLDTSATADISSQGQLLSALSSLLPAGMQDKVNLLQTDLNSVDPSKLSDDDLKSFLSKLKTDLGALPGALSNFDPDTMSSDDLNSARSSLSEMKSAVSSLGTAGSAMAYSGLSATQEANLAAMSQQVASMSGSGSTEGSGELSLLTGFNPSGDGSDSDSANLYSLLSSYNKASLLGGTDIMGKLAAEEKSASSATTSADASSGTATGLGSTELSQLLSGYLGGSSSMTSLLESYSQSSAAAAPQSTVDYTV